MTMQGAADVTGDFRFYQGVWRLQELPNCAQPGYTATLARNPNPHPNP